GLSRDRTRMRFRFHAFVAFPAPNRCPLRREMLWLLSARAAPAAASARHQHRELVHVEIVGRVLLAVYAAPRPRDGGAQPRRAGAWRGRRTAGRARAGAAAASG